MGSTEDLSAWGIMILRIICRKVSPRDLAASICPGAIVFIPLIRCSEQNAEGINIVAAVTHTS